MTPPPVADKKHRARVPSIEPPKMRVSTTTTTIGLQLLLLLASCSNSISLSYFMMTSNKEKCVTVSVAGGTKLLVDYDAPDLHTEEGGPITLSVSNHPLRTMRDLSTSKKASRKKAKQSKATKKDIEEARGAVIHKVPQDSEVDICFQLNTKMLDRKKKQSKKKKKGSNNNVAFRFGISVTKMHLPFTANTTEHFANLQQQAIHLTDTMKDILHHADLIKEQDILVHNQANRMEEASIWWPVVQLCVLLVTGFTQATSMVRFFKSRNIL